MTFYDEKQLLEEKLDRELYVDEVIEFFKYIDKVNYEMYVENGLTDTEIYEIITSESIKPLYIKG